MEVDTSTTTTKPLFAYVRSGDYLFLNLHLKQKIRDRYTLYLHVTNLFDTDEQEVFCPRQRLEPLPGRWYILTPVHDDPDTMLSTIMA